MSDKTSLGAGKKRTINFNTGSSAQETIVAEGMLKSNLIGESVFQFITSLLDGDHLIQ